MLVSREDAGGVATLTSNRPDKLNAINIALMVDLRGHLDEVVEEVAREITENSWGTNRIDKALLRAHGDRSRTDALVIERGAPYGFPKDGAERMSRRPSKQKSG
jgi:enoyl-CoA hydratase/carnithine racemase